VTQDGNTLTAIANVAVVGSAAMTQDGNTLISTMALDLIIAVVSGAIRGTGATGTAYGMSETGVTFGTKSTGSI
jgi:predicted Rossmann fold nucleotide-binding protein DprA/Smf involved in DNA uptake